MLGLIIIIEYLQTVQCPRTKFLSGEIVTNTKDDFMNATIFTEIVNFQTYWQSNWCFMDGGCLMDDCHMPQQQQQLQCHPLVPFAQDFILTLELDKNDQD